jgi:hypothetical protein
MSDWPIFVWGVRDAISCAPERLQSLIPESSRVGYAVITASLVLRDA